MRTYIDIDDALMADAMEALGTTIRRDTVLESLRRTIRARQQRVDRQTGPSYDGSDQSTRGHDRR